MVILGLIYGIAFVSFLYGLFRKKIDPEGRYNSHLRAFQSAGFAVKALVLINMAGTITILSLFLWSGVALLLLFTEKKILKPTVLGLGKDGISVPGYFGQHLISWDLVLDLVVRTDFVTITRENRSYVQLELLADMDEKDIAGINRFAREQILTHRKSQLVHE